MIKNKKNSHLNQKSFYFKDYDHHPDNIFKKNKINITEDRIYLLFFVFFSLFFIFTLKIFITSAQVINSETVQDFKSVISKPLRNDITDRNGEIIAKNIQVYHILKYHLIHFLCIF